MTCCDLEEARDHSGGGGEHRPLYMFSSGLGDKAFLRPGGRGEDTGLRTCTGGTWTLVYFYQRLGGHYLLQRGGGTGTTGTSSVHF